MPQQPTDFPRNLHFSRLIRWIATTAAMTTSCHGFEIRLLEILLNVGLCDMFVKFWAISRLLYFGARLRNR
jgi:hypothetical protein